VSGACRTGLGEGTTGIDYLAGVLMVALGVVGYLLLRHSALTLPVVAGCLTLVIALLGDVADTEEDGSAHTILLYAGIEETVPDASDVVDDIWTAMAVGLLCCVGLTALQALTQYAGYARCSSSSA